MCLSAAIPCTARIITVDDDGPADFNNIQAAIDDSKDGDTIIVADGIYTGDGNRDIDFIGKAITVRSTDPNDPNIVATTIIDCNGTEEEPHRGFYFHSGEDANSILDGLTITNGYAKYGGGIHCGLPLGSPPGPGPPPPPPPPLPPGAVGSQSSPEILSAYNLTGPTITNCIISGNYSNVGGGMHNDWLSNLTLTNCTFIGNSASDSGGGMDNGWSIKATLENCTFSENSAQSGGGMYNSEDSKTTLTNCSFCGNSAS